LLRKSVVQEKAFTCIRNVYQQSSAEKLQTVYSGVKTDRKNMPASASGLSPDEHGKHDPPERI
jgi:hypothetical protein